MTRHFVRVRALGLGGLWFLLGACEGTNVDGRPSGSAGTFHAADAGAQLSDAGGGDSGVSGSDPNSAASAMNVEPGASAGRGSAENGHGGKRGTNPGAGEGGAGEGGASGAGASESGASGSGTSEGGTSEGGASGHADNGGGAGVREVMIPCEVYEAYSVCRNCHLDPPINGAPMALLTLQDLQFFAGSAYQAVQTGVMPAEGKLTGKERALILAWLADGAQGVPRETCP